MDQKSGSEYVAIQASPKTLKIKDLQEMHIYCNGNEEEGGVRNPSKILSLDS